MKPLFRSTKLEIPQNGFLVVHGVHGLDVGLVVLIFPVFHGGIVGINGGDLVLP